MWALSRTRRSQNAHGFGSGPSAAEKIFLFKKHSKYAFFCSPAAPPTWREQTIPSTPGPQELAGDQRRSDAESVFNRL
jgi:hypothetical protein